MESIAGESMFPRASRCLALAGMVIAGASGCATSGTPADSYELVLVAPGLESAQPRVVGIYDDYSQTVDQSTWKTSNAAWPQAVLMFWRIKDNFRGKQIYVHEKPLSELIVDFLPGENVTLGSVGRSKNKVGRLEFQRFRRASNAECIFVRQGVDRFSDQVEVVGSGEPLGDMVIRGWYCVDSAESDPDAAFQGFIAGIGIRGWALP